MANPSPHVGPGNGKAPVNPATSIPPELADLVSQFLALAQNLPPPSGKHNDFSITSEQGGTNSHMENRESNGKTRSYYFPPNALRLEKDLLKKYQADDFQDLLAEVYNLLVGLVKLMKSVPHDMKVNGYIIVSLGCLLGQACSLVRRMQTVYGDVQLVQKEKA